MGRGVNDKFFGNPDDHDNPVFYLWCQLDGDEGNANIIKQVDDGVFFVQMMNNPNLTGYVKLANEFPWKDGMGFMWWQTENRSGTVLELRGREFLGVNWYGDEGYIKMPYTLYYNEAMNSGDTVAYISYNSWD